MLIVTDGENGPGAIFERRDEQLRACEALGVGTDNIVWGSLPDLDVGNHEREVVSLIETVIKDFGIDLIYTHGIHDTHQDHRAVALGTLGAARKCHRILFYDSPSSYDFQPTLFVDIADTLEKKITALLCHASQVAASEKVSSAHVRGEAFHRGRQSLTMAAEGFVPHRFLIR